MKQFLLTAAALPLVVTASGAAQPARAHSSPGLPAPSAPTAAVRYRPPVPLHVLRGFDPPATRYGRGHLGVDLAGAQRAAVMAAAEGTVTFAGRVAGRGVVVVTHADGIRTEYEPVRATVRVGQAVMTGQVVGTIEGAHRGCRQSCLHWGARHGVQYLDPLTLLRSLGPVRLLPWSKDPRRG